MNYRLPMKDMLTGKSIIIVGRLWIKQGKNGSSALHRGQAPLATQGSFQSTWQVSPYGAKGCIRLEFWPLATNIIQLLPLALDLSSPGSLLATLCLLQIVLFQGEFMQILVCLTIFFLSLQIIQLSFWAKTLVCNHLVSMSSLAERRITLEKIDKIECLGLWSWTTVTFKYRPSTPGHPQMATSLSLNCYGDRRWKRLRFSLFCLV